MCLENLPSVEHMQELKIFAEWIAYIGDGTIRSPMDCGSDIQISHHILLKGGDNPIGTIVDTIYPDFRNRMDDHDYLQNRAILAPTLDLVKSINDHIIRLSEKESRTYLSSDSPCRSDVNVDIIFDVHTPEFLNELKCSGVPDHELILKVGTSVMLLRNTDHSRGLCNGTRLVITRMSDILLEAKVLTGSSAGQLDIIPRLSLTPSDPRLPFKFQCRQFPVIVSYAVSINKSQGQSFSHVGLFLQKLVFSHGQLYVVVSRITNPQGLNILLYNNDPHN